MQTGTSWFYLFQHLSIADDILYRSSGDCEAREVQTQEAQSSGRNRRITRSTLEKSTIIPDNACEVGLINRTTEQSADSQAYRCGCFWFKEA